MSKDKMKEEAKHNIRKLVERFRYNLDVYKKSTYNETQVRIEFIDPFFEAMGWDVGNKQDHAEQYKDVVHEDTIKIGDSTKAPDYSFRIGGQRKFFVEAKKPSINIKENVSPSYQLRRYAWSAKLPLSIVTDFEEFSVFDCRIKPNQTDKVSVGRIAYYTFEEYLDKFDEIYDVFSKDAILKGSFDRHVQSTKGKRGTAEVDSEFLKEIENWRELLAKNIALRNSDVSIYELNYAVQKIIDRIIFLRICEDRGIEPYGQLQPAAESTDIYMRLLNHFKLAESKYNSGIFDFGYDNITPTLRIDDKVLKTIIGSLYYPISPYEFSVLGVEILGNVYEQFLGKVIRLTAGHQAKVETKPEVKKAGGVYYTPQYIVDYIVKNTVGKLVEGKTPEEIAKITILDPACGSGSFLIGAYSYLLQYHLDWYMENKPKKHKKAVFQVRDNEWYLTTTEKKRILLNNIYGVDIDSQAVEVTKLSLQLKVLENESMESIDHQVKLGMEGVLPNIGGNIKCGNSLIGPDFYDAGQMILFDEDEMRRVNVFDWEDDVKGFGEIMSGGGFDCVIGNPPYLRIQGLQEYYSDQIDYLIMEYQSAVKRFDLYLLFAEKGYKLLSKDGRLGFICPHKFINSDFGSGLRKFLLDNSAIKSFISFGNNLIFKQASTYTGILLLKKDNNTSFNYYEFQNIPISELAVGLSALTNENFTNYDLKSFTKNPWVLTHKNVQMVLKKLSYQAQTIGDVFVEILVGVQSGIDNIYVLKTVSEPFDGVIKLFSERADKEISIEMGLIKPFIRGEDVHRYTEPRYSYYCIYPYKMVNEKTKIIEKSELKEKYPLGYNYLKQYQTELKEIRVRQKTNPKYWYSCHRSRNMVVFESDRIITPEISLGCNMTLAPKGVYHNTKVYSLLPSPSRPEHMGYWLGILNSKVMWWFLSNTGYVLRGGYYVFKTNYLKPFPIHIIDFSNQEENAQHDKLVALVDNMLEFQKKYHEARMERDKEIYERQIKIVDEQIDRLVYDLYGLTEEEIRVIEDGR
jgi:type I restriction-modification system DNA methylase subunit